MTNHYKLLFSDGTYFITSLKGDIYEAENMFLGRLFNFGKTTKDSVRCIKIEPTL